MDDLQARISSIQALLESLQRDIARLDPAVIRVGDNIDMTRHSVNNSIQVIANEVGTIRNYLHTLAKDLGPVIDAASEMREARAQVSGGVKVVYWIWPLLSVLIAIGAIGIAAYVRYSP